MSQITSHILDLSTGKPAEGVKIFFYKLSQNQEWNKITEGTTNHDGRLTNLLSNEVTLDNGIYKLSFITGVYFSEKKIKTFYPCVEIVFEIDSSEHYHVPLLISPFGYTTYRGS